MIFSFYLNRWLRTLANHDNTTILAYFRDETPQILLTDLETIAVHQNMSHVYLSGAYLLDPFYELHNSGLTLTISDVRYCTRSIQSKPIFFGILSKNYHN